MVIFDQLRISDDGQKLYLDAHVNQASYFEDVTLKKVTVCTEEQVSELNPQMYSTDFIYQADIHPIDTVAPLYDNIQILSEKHLMDEISGDGGWNVEYTPPTGAEDCYLSVAFSGKYSVFEEGTTPKLVVAAQNFDPFTGSLESDNVLFTINGEQHTEKGHTYWLFKGKGLVSNYQNIQLHLFKQGDNDAYEAVGLDETDDVNFLHFLWQVWYTIPGTSQKEVHLVLTKADFNAAFNNTNNGEAIVETKPTATKAFGGTDLSHNMFFVYIETDGAPDECVPCTLDEPVTLGVTFDYGAMFNPAMNYTKELADSCNVPSGFIDFILNYDALKMALETEHYVPAINYWKRLMGMSGVTGTTYGTTYNSNKPCGCHG